MSIEDFEAVLSSKIAGKLKATGAKVYLDSWDGSGWQAVMSVPERRSEINKYLYLPEEGTPGNAWAVRAPVELEMYMRGLGFEVDIQYSMNSEWGMIIITKEPDYEY